MIKKNWTDSNLGFHFGPFEIDRVNLENFEEEKIYEMLYVSQRISEILSNRDQFQIIIGYPGTGKTLVLLSLRKDVNEGFLEDNTKEMAVYIDLVEDLTNIKDWGNEKEHKQLFNRKIITEITKTFLLLLQNKIEKFKSENNKAKIKEIKSILTKFQGHPTWNKIKKIMKLILKTTTVNAFKKMNIDLDSSSIDNPESAGTKDISELIESIVESSDHKINKIILLFDEIGEYTKNWYTRQKKEINSSEFPPIFDILFAIKNKSNVKSKVSCYVENYEMFLNYGFEHSHLHPTFLDPDLKSDEDFKNEMEDYAALLKNMTLKRIEKLSLPEFIENDIPYIKLVSDTPDNPKYALIEEEKYLDAVAFISNFNPRISLEFLKRAWDLAKSRENSVISFPKDASRPEGYVIAYNTGNKNLKKALGIVSDGRERGLRALIDSSPIAEKFFMYLLLNGANYFTVPKKSALSEDTSPIYKDFKELVEKFIYPRRVFLSYQTTINYQNELRALYGIESRFLLSVISKFKDREELKQSADFQRLKNNYTQYYHRLKHYFHTYHVTLEDIESGFQLHSEIATIKSQINELNKELKEISFKLNSPTITDEEEIKWMDRERDLRRQIRALNAKKEEIKVESEKQEELMRNEYDAKEYIDTYGKSEIGEMYIEDKIYEETKEILTEEETGISEEDKTEELSYKLKGIKDKYLFQYKSSNERVKNIAEALFEALVKTGFIKRKNQFNFTSSYIKIAPPNKKSWYWRIIFSKTRTQLNLFLDSKEFDELQVYTNWDMSHYAGNYLCKLVFYNIKDYQKFHPYFLTILKKIIEEK